MPSRRSPPRGSFQPPGPQRCRGGERARRPHAAGLLRGKARTGLASPGPQAQRWGSLPRRAPLLAPQEDPGSAESPPGQGAMSGRCHRAFPRLPGTTLGAPHSAAGGPGLLSPPSLGRTSGGAACPVLGLTRTSTGPLPAALSAQSGGSQEGAALAEDAPQVCPASAAAGLHRPCDIQGRPRNVFRLPVHLPHVFCMRFIL